jgi:hypothetical protein
MGRGDRMMAPAYVLITVSSVSDADAFKKAIQDMTAAAISKARSQLGQQSKLRSLSFSACTSSANLPLTPKDQCERNHAM